VRDNNGKTTLLEVIREALGDKEYAGQVQVDSLMVRPKEAMSNNAVNTDLGAREPQRQPHGNHVRMLANQARFLAAHAITCSVAEAARLSKITRYAHRDWLRNDPIYPPRFRAGRRKRHRLLRMRRCGGRTRVCAGQCSIRASRW
jgi:hypothetical protein